MLDHTVHPVDALPCGFPTSPAFQAWAGAGAVLLDHGDLTAEDFAGPGPFIVRGAHGTTHAFDRFDSRVLGNPEGHYGAVHYFSSDPWDAWDHYALPSGPDLKNRVEHEAEMLVAQLEMDHPDLDYPELTALAKERAQARLVGPESRLLDCLIRLENPFLTGERTRWSVDALPCFDDVDPLLDDGEDPDDEDTRDAAYDRAIEAWYAQVDGFGSAAAAASGLYGSFSLASYLMDAGYNGTGLSLERCIQRAESEIGLYNEEGQMIGSAYFSALVAAMGYDGIVLLDADQRHKSMHLAPGTAHIQVFDHAHGQVKLHSASAFDPADPRITA